MPAFQRKPTRFFAKGMNLNVPIDSIPEGEFAYLKNVRAYVDGRLGLRPGLQQVTSFADGGATDYLHSGRTVDGVRFVGFNSDLYADGVQIDSGFTGNPLSFIPFNPGDGTNLYLYVYDSIKQNKYSPLTPATILDIGLPQVQEAPVPIAIAGSLDGDYYWRWRKRDVLTGAQSAPGPPTYTASTELYTPRYALSLQTLFRS